MESQTVEAAGGGEGCLEMCQQRKKSKTGAEIHNKEGSWNYKGSDL